MPRTKGSKNRPKTNNDYASQIAEKQEYITSLTAEIASIQKAIEEHIKREEDCSEEGRKRSGNPGSEEGKVRC